METEKLEIEATKKSLRALLTYFMDEPLLYSRKTWATILQVSEESISDWLTGETMPASRMFNRLIGILCDFEIHDKTYKEKLKELIILMNKEIAENGSTLGDYILKPDTEDLFDSIQRLPFVLRKEILLTFLRVSNTTQYETNKDLSNVPDLKIKLRIMKLK